MKHILLDFSYWKLIKKGTSLATFFLLFTQAVFGKDYSEDPSLMQWVNSPDSTQPAFSDFIGDTLPLDPAKKLPYSHMGLNLDGQIPGVNVIRPTGEPGIAPSIFIRGISMPIGSNGDLYVNQPLWVINGIPLERNDNPYYYGIKQFDFMGVGSGIDISSLIDINNIEKLRVIKGPEAVAKYGPRASNGAIVIDTRFPEEGNYHVGLNMYGGVALKPVINSQGTYMINGFYERNLIEPFYDNFASIEVKNNFPDFLADSTGEVYFGPSNWQDLYYRHAIQHGAALNITGGSSKAKFRFGLAEHSEDGVTDNTSLKRYNVYFDMFIKPLKDLDIKVFVQAAHANRDRNNSMRERFAEMEYFPSQEFPLPPNKKYLADYYDYLKEGIDDNQVNSIQAKTTIRYYLGDHFTVNNDLTFDYNDNHRDYFVPALLNDGNSFNSYYSGINRRIRIHDYLAYDKISEGKHHLNLKIGHTLEYSRMQYSYVKASRGPSDFVKLIQVNATDGSWLTHNKNLVYSYKDYLQENIVSFFGEVNYSLRDKYSASFFLRSDGTSFFSNGNRWGISPVLRLEWDLKNEPWLINSTFVDDLKFGVSGGRTMRFLPQDLYGRGPYYTVDIGWEGSEFISTYASFPALGYPFSDGYVGGGIDWPYTDHYEARFDATFLNSIYFGANFYSKTDKDLLMSVPTDGAAYGFSGQWLNGMDVRNRGVEVSLGKLFTITKDLNWQSSLNFRYNQNELLRLPRGFKEVTYGQRRLKVGESVDRFWLLQNEGIYNSESEIPVKDGEKLTFNGVPFGVGDPKWKDEDQNGRIDDNDRIYAGHIFAPINGGWNNNIRFKNWNLNFSLVYSFKKNFIVGDVANRLDFANHQNVQGLDGVKELTFWELKNNPNEYPRFNPWSLVNPYQEDQTMFLKNGSFIKLQSVALKYDFSDASFVKSSLIRKLEVYLTGTNMFMTSPYKGGSNPALIDYMGHDYNYAAPLPLTLTFGIHADF